jgi:capsular exopolysaccharide synthesis family protein
MGRVDEALRRAYEAVNGPVVDGRPAPAPGETSGGAFGVDQFPDEIPDQAALQAPPADAAPQAEATLVSSDAAAEDTAIAKPRPTVNGTRAGRTSLFERLDAGLAEKIVVDENMAQESREQYRRLAATLHHGQAANGLKVIMVASAVAGEGKTLTAANLALTLSESYQRNVLLVDADLRKPSIHAVFKVAGDPGLAEGLMSVEDRKLPLHVISPRLTILPAGTPSSDPMAGLTSNRMRYLLDEAREAFDWVIIDTPPVGLLTDANLLAAMVDGIVLVVKAGSTPYGLVRRAVDAIGAPRVLGVVLNRATAHALEYRYGYGYYDAYRASVSRTNKTS